MSTIQQVGIIDKNGKRNTVRKKVDTASTSTLSKVGVRRSVNTEQDFDHPSFPEAEDSKTVDIIRAIFKQAVEFRFQFEIDNGSLYLMNRTIVLEDGYLHSDETASEENLVGLDEVGSRVAEMYHLLGAFGSRQRVRVVDQESESRYVAIRLD